jgi:hypothetical protein
MVMIGAWAATWTPREPLKGESLEVAAGEIAAEEAMAKEFGVVLWRQQDQQINGDIIGPD